VGGTTSIDTETYEEGTSVTITAAANAGYRFVNWTEDGEEVSTSESYTFTVTANRTLVANFEEIPPNTYTITASANPAVGGTTSIGTETYEEGTSVTITAAANEGYSFVNWTEDGEEVSTSESYTFTVNANRTLVANFEENTSARLHESINISLYPNPANGQVTIAGATPGSTIRISNISGSIVFQQSSTTDIEQLSLQGIQHGCYFVTVENELGRYTGRLIIK
jgi:hypothetical protein